MTILRFQSIWSLLSTAYHPFVFVITATGACRLRAGRTPWRAQALRRFDLSLKSLPQTPLRTANLLAGCCIAEYRHSLVRQKNILWLLHVAQDQSILSLGHLHVALARPAQVARLGHLQLLRWE